jgi:hypothetical protein
MVTMPVHAIRKAARIDNQHRLTKIDAIASKEEGRLWRSFCKSQLVLEVVWKDVFLGASCRDLERHCMTDMS